MSQVKQVRFRIIIHILNKHEKAAGVITRTEERRHPAQLRAQVPSRKVNRNWKRGHRDEKYQGTFSPGSLITHLICQVDLSGLPPKKAEFLGYQDHIFTDGPTWKRGPHPEPRRQFGSKTPVFLVIWFSF